MQIARFAIADIRERQNCDDQEFSVRELALLDRIPREAEIFISRNKKAWTVQIESFRVRATGNRWN